MSNDLHALSTDTVRSTVTTWFQRLGASHDAPISETLLIRDGYFCGRRYRTGELEAVWFFEEQQLKIYGAGGAVANVFEVSSLLNHHEERRAA